jgi:arylformamidase
MMKIFDISIPISPSLPVWPGDPPVDIQQVAKITSGDSANVSHISMGVHCGTHIDAPKHFIDTGKSIDQIPLEKLIGEVLVMEIDSAENVISERVLTQHPKQTLLETASKVIFRTRNSSLWSEYPHTFQEDYVGIDTTGALYLSQFHFDLIGIDYLSIAPYHETLSPHQILLAAEIVLLEGLNLSEVPTGVYELYCLPLKIPGCEGSPARVVLVDQSG